MTVSRRRSVIKAALLGASLMVSSAVWAQDQDTEREPEAGSDESAAQTPRPTIAADQQRRRLYLGKQPRAARQRGVLLSKPRSILPEPFVPPGSLAIPPLAAPQPVDAGEMVAEGASPDEMLAGVLPIEDGQDGQDGAVEVENGSVSLVQQGFEAGTLDDLDTSVQAIDPAAVEAGFWSGYDHVSAVNILAKLATMPLSDVLRKTAQDLSLGGFDLEDSDFEGAELDLLRARLGLLMAVGDANGYRSILSDLPDTENTADLRWENARAALYAGDLADACARADEARLTDGDAFWVRIAVMCAAARGNRSGVDFQLGILEQLGPVEASFYTLSDMILVEAEQGEGTGGAGLSLTAPLEVDSLSVAMARLSRAQVETVDLSAAPPIGLKALLALPGLTAGASYPVLRRALIDGVADTGTVMGRVRLLQVENPDRGDLFVAAETDASFRTDLRLMDVLGDEDANMRDRMSALKSLWRRALEGGYAGGLSPTLLELTRGLPAQGLVDESILVRAALLAGNMQRAEAHMAGLRAQASLDVLDSVTALQSLTLLGATTPESAGFVSPLDSATFQGWYLASSERNPLGARSQAALVLAVSDALEMGLTDEDWAAFMNAGEEGGRTQAAPIALWRQLVKARAEGDRPQVLMTGAALLGRVDPLMQSPAMLGSVIASLRLAGFEKEAHALALDLLVRAGV